MAVRVRPFNQREEDGGSKCCIEMVTYIVLIECRAVRQLLFMILQRILRKTSPLTTVFGPMIASRLHLMEGMCKLQTSMLIRMLSTMRLESRSLIMPGKGIIAVSLHTARLALESHTLW